MHYHSSTCKKGDFESPFKEKISQHLENITSLIECIDRPLTIAYIIFSKWANSISVKIIWIRSETHFLFYYAKMSCSQGKHYSYGKPSLIPSRCWMYTLYVNHQHWHGKLKIFKIPCQNNVQYFVAYETNVLLCI